MQLRKSQSVIHLTRIVHDVGIVKFGMENCILNFTIRKLYSIHIKTL